MQVTTPSTVNAPVQSQYMTQSSYAQVTSYKQRRIDINYTDDTSSVRLSISSTSLQESVLYTEKGSYVTTTDSAAKTIAPANSDATAADDTKDVQTAQLQEVLDRYQILISRRVMYLLRTIAEERQRISGEQNHTTASESENTLLSTYYSEETTEVQIDLTVESTSPLTGAFSPGNTANRIVDFALSFYDGGDRQAYADNIKSAVMKGFEEAKGALGGWAPQESYDTISLAIASIDEWANGGMELTA